MPVGAGPGAGALFSTVGSKSGRAEAIDARDAGGSPGPALAVGVGGLVAVGQNRIASPTVRTAAAAIHSAFLDFAGDGAARARLDRDFFIGQLRLCPISGDRGSGAPSIHRKTLSWAGTCRSPASWTAWANVRDSFVVR
jgi:hypothetical protein